MGICSKKFRRIVNQIEQRRKLIKEKNYSEQYINDVGGNQKNNEQRMKIYRPQLIEEKSTEELKKGIIQELRILMVSFNSLIESENRIRKIQISNFLLHERKSSVYNEISELEKETKWKFTELFDDCVSYPDKSIHPSKYYSIETRENSICQVCEEYTADITNQEIKICDSCLKKCRNSIENKSMLEECILFKTPEKEYWCYHANENTLLLSTDKYCVSKSTIICKICIENEELKRK